ncbi:MAG: amidase family protein [Pseudomonadota bacterium]
MDRRDLLKAMSGGALALTLGCARKPAVNSEKDLLKLDAIAQADLVVSGKVSATELTRAALKRIEQLNPALNAIIFQDPERALIQAKTAAGQLAGVPYLIKDLNAYKGMPLTRGSKLFADFEPESQTAFTNRIDATGVVVLGKTNTPEFGLLPSTEPLLHGATRNPWDLSHTPGGSSGGSAAAVAARIVPAAQGGDGGGSIRIPAAMCGLFGLKPTAGRFPDQGHGDQPWPISIKHALTLSVRDSALLLALTERDDNPDLLPVGFVQPERVKPMRIGLSMNTMHGAPDQEIADAVLKTAARLADLGHEIIEIDGAPLLDEQFSDDFLVLWSAGSFSVAERVRQQTGVAAAQSGLLEPATVALAEQFAKRPKDALPRAIEGLARYQQSTIEFLNGFDAWLTPVTASVAPEIGVFAPDRAIDELMPAVSKFAAYTPAHNAAGTPAMSIPCGWNDDGLPLAAQISAGPGQEATLLKLAYQLEEAHGWIDRLPEMTEQIAAV